MASERVDETQHVVEPPRDEEFVSVAALVPDFLLPPRFWEEPQAAEAAVEDEIAAPHVYKVKFPASEPITSSSELPRPFKPLIFPGGPDEEQIAREVDQAKEGLKLGIRPIRSGIKSSTRLTFVGIPGKPKTYLTEDELALRTLAGQIAWDDNRQLAPKWDGIEGIWETEIKPKIERSFNVEKL